MNRHCTMHLFMSLLVCCGVASTAHGQSESESKAPYQMPSPKGWRKERIKLPPAFAPKMNWKGHEDIRFAPGMFDPKSDSFFSYDILFGSKASARQRRRNCSRRLRSTIKGSPRPCWRDASPASNQCRPS